jgi:hypothetical protein
MQTRLGSLTETITNVFVGLIISLVLNATIFPLFGWVITMSQNLSIAAIYTVVSIIRSYFMRRIFNYISIRFRF